MVLPQKDLDKLDDNFSPEVQSWKYHCLRKIMAKGINKKSKEKELKSYKNLNLFKRF
jgi:hypothetical protein